MSVVHTPVVNPNRDVHKSVLGVGTSDLCRPGTGGLPLTLSPASHSTHVCCAHRLTKGSSFSGRGCFSWLYH